MCSHASAGALTLYSICEEDGLVFLIKGSGMNKVVVVQNPMSWIPGIAIPGVAHI